MKNLHRVWEESFTKRKYRIGLHIAFWVVYILMLQMLDYIMTTSVDYKWDLYMRTFWITCIINLILFGAIYYLTLFFPYKNIFVKKRYILGLLFLAICIIIYIHLFYLLESLAIWFAVKNGYPLPPFTRNVLPYFSKGYLYFMSIPVLIFQMGFSYFMYMFLPICCKFLRDQMRMQKKQSELQKKNIQLEMDFLKAQIHPHFLFNTLNNIYSLIIQHENRKSAEMVSGLSSLLRYALYDGKTEFILLEKEVNMIKDFIGLEEVRTDNMHLDVKFPLEVPVAMLPPFLLLPLIENAFKHGANSQLRDPCVKIEMEIIEQLLWLQVKNCFDPEYRKKNSGGLGLLNLKKRLNYYYHDSYFLETDEKNDVFTATLKLPMSCPVLNA